MTIFTPEFSVVWFEIPVSNLKKSTAFYEAVLQTKLQESEMGSGPVMIFRLQTVTEIQAGCFFKAIPSIVQRWLSIWLRLTHWMPR